VKILVLFFEARGTLLTLIRKNKNQSLMSELNLCDKLS